MTDDAASVTDKRGLLAKARAGGGAILELGCGPAKQVAGAIGIDMLDTDAVDVLGEAVAALKRFPDRAAASVHSFHFFEHVPDLDALLHETARVLDDGGVMEVVVPHFSNPYFYSDPTHRAFFGLYTFSYLADEKLFSRKVPNYGKGFGFELRSVDLVFKSPFTGRNAMKRLVGSLVNATTAFKELYEENFAFIIPCYEIRYVLARKAR